jgi:hypothetical protein
MSGQWVAGCVRARALARRRLGSDGARRIASSGSLHEALTQLAHSPYGHDVRTGLSLTEAQHMVARTLLWNLRVLAGWLPGPGAALLRTLAGWFEIANTDELLHARSGGAEGPMFELGALATAWPRLRTAGSPAELRAALAASPWQDPCGQDPLTIRLGMRASWAARVAALPGPASSWAAAAAALLLASEKFASGRELPDSGRAQVSALLGSAAVRAATLDEMARGLPHSARWVLPPGTDPVDLWRAESRWWAQVERDGSALLACYQFSAEPALGVAAVLAVDARRLRAALEMAARGGHPLDTYAAVAEDAVTDDAPT